MTTTLNGATIADPYDINIQRKSLSTSERSINGTLHIDYFSTNLDGHITIKMKWRLITISQLSTLKTRVEDCIANTRTLVLPDSLSFSVRYDPESPYVQIPVRSAGTWLYNVECGFLVI
jgi:hypothetical protein